MGSAPPTAAGLAVWVKGADGEPASSSPGSSRRRLVTLCRPERIDAPQ
jgi:hypothetical protein